MLDRESNVSAVHQRNEVLEVDLFEAESGFTDFTLAISNLENDLLGALSHVVSPKADGDRFARTFEHKFERRQLNLSLHLGHHTVVKVLAANLHRDDFFHCEEFAYYGHSTVRVENTLLNFLYFFYHLLIRILFIFN